MSSFTTPARLELMNKYKFMLVDSFFYHVGSYPSNEIIEVPSGFVTDLASIPRILWWALPPHGKYAKAAIIHDWMYVTAYKNKNYADKVFLEGMGVLGVPKWKRKMMYHAVRLFGKGKYKE
jgi:hypothetical protein